MPDDLTERLSKLIEDVAEAIKPFIESGMQAVEQLSDAIHELFEPIGEIIGCLIAEINDIKPKTKPPRDIVKVIGGKPVTRICAMRVHRTQAR